MEGSRCPQELMEGEAGVQGDEWKGMQGSKELNGRDVGGIRS